MTQREQAIADFKQSSIERMKMLTVEQGGLQPMIIIFAEETTEEKTSYGEIVIPVPQQFFQAGEDGKDILVDLLPHLFNKVCVDNNRELVPLCLAWASEAWLRKAPKNENGSTEVPENWKELPKTEVMMMFTEDEVGAEIQVLEMKRDGTKVDAEGNMIDNISLEEIEGLTKQDRIEGRFTKVFQKIKAIRTATPEL